MKCFRFFLFFAFLLVTALHASETTLILDSMYKTLPKKTRSMNTGHLDYFVSASGQYYEHGLHVIKCIHSDPQINQGLVVDLREESHGYINGIPVSWNNGQHNNANLDKSAELIEADEKSKIRQIKMGQKMTLALDDNAYSTEVVVESARTERELVESYGLSYRRIPVTDHFRPSDKAVDQLVDLMRNIPQDMWVHFHCKGGSGRTSTALVMFDIIKHHSKESFDSILKRQKTLGGKDLTLLDPSSFKYEAAKERLEFIKKFYEYCQEVPDFSIAWSNWVK